MDYASLIKQIDPNFHHDNTFGADFSEIKSQFTSNLEQMKKNFESNIIEKSAEKRNYQSRSQDLESEL